MSKKQPKLNTSLEENGDLKKNFVQEAFEKWAKTAEENLQSQVEKLGFKNLKEAQDKGFEVLTRSSKDLIEYRLAPKACETSVGTMAGVRQTLDEALPSKLFAPDYIKAEENLLHYPGYVRITCEFYEKETYQGYEESQEYIYLTKRYEITKQEFKNMIFGVLMFKDVSKLEERDIKIICTEDTTFEIIKSQR